MLTNKLKRIKELIIEKERIDTELAHLLGEEEKPRGGRRSRLESQQEEGVSEPAVASD